MLGAKRGIHTELVSVVIPHSKTIAYVTKRLRHEITESANIKSKTTRKHVILSISAILQKLKTIRCISKNGLIFYSGVISKHEMYVIEPIEPIASYKYYCGADFLIKTLQDQLVDKETYGVVVIDTNEFSIASVCGSNIKYHKHKDSGISGSHRAGGQSAQRFARMHEEAVMNFVGNCAEYMTKIFLPIIEELEGIFVGGSGFAKNKLIASDRIDYRLRQKLIKNLVDIGTQGNDGVRDILYRCKTHILNVPYVREKDLMQRFFTYIAKDSKLVTYGKIEVKERLLRGAVKTLILSEKLNPITVNSLGKIANEYGTRIEIVSTNTEEGKALIETFGGIVSINRY